MRLTCVVLFCYVDDIVFVVQVMAVAGDNSSAVVTLVLVSAASWCVTAHPTAPTTPTNLLMSAVSTSTNHRAVGLFSYKLRYIIGFELVEMAISTNPNPTTYHNLYENSRPAVCGEKLNRS